MSTATYEDYIARYPGTTASRQTVEAFIEDVSAEISARCTDRGTTYDALVEDRGPLVRRIECSAAFRMCGRASIDGIDQNSLDSFSQTVGDHSWSYGYASGNGKTLLLDAEWKALGLAGMQIGWVGEPWVGGYDD